MAADVQLYAQEAGIPAINELRYAGHHLLRSLNAEGAVTSADDLKSARIHVERAAYEAGEAGVAIALKQLRAFKLDYKDVVVSAVVPQFPAIMADAEEWRRKTETRRAFDAERTLDTDQRMEAFRRLSAHVAVLDAARDELNKVVARERRDLRRFIINAILSLLALVVSVIGAIVGYAALFKP